MLSAAGRLGAAAGPGGRWGAAPLGGSLLMHAVVVAALLVRVAPQMKEQPPIEVELVQQEAQVHGAPAPPAPAPTPPQGSAGNVQAAPLVPPPPPRSTPPATPASEINLGTGPQDLDSLSVTSKDLIPATPDSRFRNRPPGYPPEAARIGASGIVQLMIHVSAAGLASEVVVAHSSGFESLDSAAKRAVQLWRFRPARNAGRAVPFDYLLNIRFSVGNDR